MRTLRAWPEGEFFRLDVTDLDAWRQLAIRLAADFEGGRFKPAPLLVNNAGVCAAEETLASDPAAWRRIMDVNFFGVLNGCQALGPMLRRWPRYDGGHARIINVASVAGWLAGPSMGAYSASKAAVIALSEALYAELRSAGVGVTVVAPGFFRTGLLDRGTFCTTRHRAEAERLSRRAKFTADDVARIALRASERGQLYAVMGGRARWLWRVKRLAPRLLQRIIASRYHRTFAGVEDDEFAGAEDDEFAGVEDDPARPEALTPDS
jgi:NAD(P)-dependent dehydrogenase (short-subunit alcohol dehydrogenase family)